MLYMLQLPQDSLQHHCSAELDTRWMHLERGLDGRNVAAVGIDGILWQIYCNHFYNFLQLVRRILSSSITAESGHGFHKE